MSVNEYIQPSPNRVTTPGDLLSRRRQSKGLSLQQASSELKISENKLKALENNQFDAFVAETYTKGYLKSYARLLKLSETEIMLSYADFVGQNANDDQEQQDLDQESGRRGSFKWWWPYSVVTAALIVWLAGYWWFSQPQQPIIEDVFPIAADQEIDKALAAVEEPVTAQESPAIAETPEVLNDQLDNQDETSLAAADTPGATESIQPTESPETAEAPATSPVDIVTPEPESPEPVQAIARLQDQLRFEFSQDCWVKVVDANGKVLAAKLLRSGQRLELAGKAPFAITLGNARGVSLAFNDKPFTLALQDNRNTLRFTVGG